jgi:RNA polymerase sigma-70 factor (ECF subfamily)
MKQTSKIGVTISDEKASNQSSDEELIAIASAGNEEAFEQIFNRHHWWVTRIVGRFFRRPERVEEVVQEIFTKLYFTLSYFSPQPGKTFANWLSSIAINSCYDELRRLKRKPEASISEITENEANWLKSKLSDEGQTTAETQVIIRDLATKLLAELSAEDRLVLTLLDVEQLSISEIAKLTGWSESKVKVRIYRARIALRGLLSRFL